jgi:hypothetical protein
MYCVSPNGSFTHSRFCFLLRLSPFWASFFFVLLISSLLLLVLGVSQSCTTGRFLSIQGSNSPCNPCPIGSFSNLNNSAGCTPCQPGRFADSELSAQCSACDTGRYAATTGNERNGDFVECRLSICVIRRSFFADKKRCVRRRCAREKHTPFPKTDS